MHRSQVQGFQEMDRTGFHRSFVFYSEPSACMPHIAKYRSISFQLLLLVPTQSRDNALDSIWALGSNLSSNDTQSMLHDLIAGDTNHPNTACCLKTTMPAQERPAKSLPPLQPAVYVLVLVRKAQPPKVGLTTYHTWHASDRCRMCRALRERARCNSAIKRRPRRSTSRSLARKAADPRHPPNIRPQQDVSPLAGACAVQQRHGKQPWCSRWPGQTDGGPQHPQRCSVPQPRVIAATLIGCPTRA